MYEENPQLPDEENEALQDTARKQFLLEVHKDITQKSGPYSQRLERGEGLIGPILRYFADHLAEYGCEAQAGEIYAVIDAKFPGLFQLEQIAEAKRLKSQINPSGFDKADYLRALIPVCNIEVLSEGELRDGLRQRPTAAEPAHQKNVYVPIPSAQ